MFKNLVVHSQLSNNVIINWDSYQDQYKSKRRNVSDVRTTFDAKCRLLLVIKAVQDLSQLIRHNRTSTDVFGKWLSFLKYIWLYKNDAYVSISAFRASVIESEVAHAVRRRSRGLDRRLNVIQLFLEIRQHLIAQDSAWLRDPTL